MKVLEACFGIALILVTLSGVWLAATVRAYRVVMLGAVGAGGVLILLALF